MIDTDRARLALLTDTLIPFAEQEAETLSRRVDDKRIRALRELELEKRTLRAKLFVRFLERQRP